MFRTKNPLEAMLDERCGDTHAWGAAAIVEDATTVIFVWPVRDPKRCAAFVAHSPDDERSGVMRMFDDFVRGLEAALAAVPA